MNPPNLHLGTIGWSYNFWKGPFYPPKTPSKDYLSYYASQFNTVEVDSTFYRFPTEQTVKNWKRQTPEDFVFSLKFPRVITHIKMLKDSQSETDAFLKRASLLGEKLGPMLLQFPPNFDVEHMDDLSDYLTRLPKEYRYVVEIRNKSWLNSEFYSEITLNDQLYSLLKANGVAVAWVDSPKMPLNLDVTANFLYIRLEGDREKVKGTLGKIEADRQSDLKVWAQRIERYHRKGMEICGYFGKYFSGFPPSDVACLQKLGQLMGKNGKPAAPGRGQAYRFPQSCLHKTTYQ